MSVRAHRAAARAAARAGRAGRGRAASSSACASSRTRRRSSGSRRAAALADEALERLLERGLVGRTERELALALELEMRGAGRGAARAFDSIVAAGPHGALPHASPRDVEIERGELVVIDWGAELDGYCSDCTRTVAAGEPGERGCGGL